MSTKLTVIVGLLFISVLAFIPCAHSLSRLKDITDVEGIRKNQLIGYGLVVGLKGTGDSLNNSPFTRQSLQAMLERLGVNTRGAKLTTSNIAAVMVTASLPPFASQGVTIDVNVSALGDSSSLQGGMLLVTPLIGADGEVYAVAQGAVAVGGFAAKGKAASIVQGVPTSGRIVNGAIVEKEISFNLQNLRKLRLSLRNPDFTTARRAVVEINEFVGVRIATAINPGTILIHLPQNFPGNIVNLLTDIEQLRIEPDAPAKVIIDEASGIIVMGHNVRVSTVAVAQGNLTVTITERPRVIQPGPFAPRGAQTQTENRTNISIAETGDGKVAVLSEGVTLQQLVNVLNSLGLGPRELISILQAIKAAGALQAEIEII